MKLEIQSVPNYLSDPKQGHKVLLGFVEIVYIEGLFVNGVQVSPDDFDSSGRCTHLG